MAGFHGKKSYNHQNPYRGCMGRMVGLFDMNLGFSTNKLLTERPHRDGSDPLRSHPEPSRKQRNPSEEHVEEKPVAHKSRSSLNHIADGTSMKTLLAQEMPKEGEAMWNKPPNLVARLMGLDAVMPAHDHSLSNQRNRHGSYSKCSAGKSYEECNHWPMELSIRQQHPRNVSKEKCAAPSIHRHTFCEEGCKDVYEVCQSSPKSLTQSTFSNHPDEHKMDLVHQKFVEAKRLAMDERLRQSKEFQDALEVLSSNKELFLRFLQEPNCVFSKHLNDMQSLESSPSPIQAKQITVLKPSKAAFRNTSCKQQSNGEVFITGNLSNNSLSRDQVMVNESTKKQRILDGKRRCQNESPWTSTVDNQSSFHVRPPRKSHNLLHPTRIVVLKPTPRKAEDIRTVVASPPVSPLRQGRTSSSTCLEKSLDALPDYNKLLYARESTRQMPESIHSHSLLALSAREEPLLSNGYVGDESSHSRSESGSIECAAVSGSEVMTPTSRYSWDFVNRHHSHSSSSYSPESSVSKEAKKRLSERWALMEHGNQERSLERSSSTLGEMLAIPERTSSSVGEMKEEVNSMSSWSHAENQGQDSTCIISCKSTNGIEEGSPGRTLLRSISVPSSSGTFDAVPMEDEAKPGEIRSSIKVEKPKSGMSLKGKVSSLFFSMTKKPSKEKCDSPPSLLKYEGKRIEPTISAVQATSTSVMPNSPCCSSSSLTGLKGGHTLEVILRQELKLEENSCKNQEQPSPISVLDPPFEDESPGSLGVESNTDCEGTNRISMLDSVATTLSWDDPTFQDNSSKEATEVPKVALDEYHDRFLFVQNVIYSAGLDREYSKLAAICDHWYSSNCPLDPSLLEKLNDEQDMNLASNNTNASLGEEAIKLQQEVLERRLLFDCVNSVLFDIGWRALDVNPWLRTRNSSTRKVVELVGSELVQEVWRCLRPIFAVEGEVVEGSAGEGRDSVHKLLNKELDSTGWDWMDLESLELDAVGSEIENAVLNDLLEDAVSDVISSCYRVDYVLRSLSIVHCRKSEKYKHDSEKETRFLP